MELRENFVFICNLEISFKKMNFEDCLYDFIDCVYGNNFLRSKIKFFDVF